MGDPYSQLSPTPLPGDLRARPPPSQRLPPQREGGGTAGPEIGGRALGDGAGGSGRLPRCSCSRRPAQPGGRELLTALTGPTAPSSPPCRCQACVRLGFPFLCLAAPRARPPRRRPLTILQMEAMFRTVISLKVAAIPHRHLYKVKTGLSMVERAGGRAAARRPGVRLSVWLGEGGREGGGGGGGRAGRAGRQAEGRGVAERGSLGRGRRAGRRGGERAAGVRRPLRAVRRAPGRPAPRSLPGLSLWLFLWMPCSTLAGTRGLAGGRTAVAAAPRSPQGGPQPQHSGGPLLSSGACGVLGKPMTAPDVGH